MCGIAGFFSPSSGRATPAAGDLRMMTDAIAHRGPDGEGFHVESQVAFGHRRLAIIDVSAGQQPLFNEDQSVVVTYNGEIYNFGELTAELTRLGHRFRTRSDTEVIVHAWEAWGPRCVERFAGMFAFALWDRNQRTFFAARDRFGVKPFFYSMTRQGTLAFASEIKALRVLPGFDATVDPSAVEDYLALGYVPDPKSIFRSVAKLAPAHWLQWRVDDPAPRLQRYWDMDFEPKQGIGADDAAAQVRQWIDQAVSSRMTSEVPLGAFLSGGLDSSIVVATMAGAGRGPVTTCSIGFDRARADETAYAQQVATQFACDHHTQQVTPSHLRHFDEVVRQYDEPFADSSALPTWQVCRLARQHVTVALSGDGGDEVFGGYWRYRMHVAEERVRAMLPLGVRTPLFDLAARAYPKADWAPQWLRAKTTLKALSLGTVDAYFESVSYVRSETRARLYTDGFKAALGGYRAVEHFHRHAADFRGGDALNLVQHLDFRTYLPGDINTKVDRASMAHSLEVREPLMDHRLAQWVATLPIGLKLAPSTGKVLLRRAFQSRFSQDVLSRPKQGFAVPLREWFAGDLGKGLHQRLALGRSACAQYLDGARLRDLVAQHRQGTQDHSRTLWSVLALETFLHAL